MNIGLDYDDTYTRDPDGWSSFVHMMVARGHNVHIVSWRDHLEIVAVHDEIQYRQAPISGIHATDRKAKQKYMFDKGICIDVWIDDNPRAVIQDMGE